MTRWSHSGPSTPASAAASPALFESLEGRRLLHVGLDLGVSFQPPGGTVPEDFIADTGQAFSFRAEGGHRYGWTMNGGAWRNTWTSHQGDIADPANGFIALGHRPGLAWEIAVPNGAYRVTVAAGAPTFRGGETHRIAVEDEVALEHTATASQPAATATVEVSVEDGRLTVTAPDGTANSKLAWIQIHSVEDGADDDDDTGEDGGDGGGTQRPYGGSPAAVPGQIDAVAFDLGGQSVAFFDRDPEVNEGGAFRQDGPDILARDDQMILGWGARGEWLEYTIQNEAAGEFDLRVHAATGNPGGLLQFSIDGEAAGSPVTLQARGWESFNTYSAGSVELEAGTHVLRLTFADSAAIDVADVAWIELAAGGGNQDGGGKVEVTGWQSLPDMPVASLEGASTELDGTIYIWGGYDKPNIWKSSVNGQAFDTKTGKWRRIADLPTALTHTQAIAWNGRIYVFGGYVNTSGQSGARDDVWVYDPATDKFAHFADMPFAVASGGVALDGSRAYYVSGMFRQGYNFAGGSHKVFSIDLANPSNGWRMEADSPIARDHTASVAIDGLIYLITGQEDDDESVGVRPDMWRYNPATRQWQRLADVPDGGRGHLGQATFAWNGQIILLGGNTNGQPGHNYADEVFAYDPATNQWEHVASLPAPRRAAHARAIGEDLYVIGGGDGIPRLDAWRARIAVG